MENGQAKVTALEIARPQVQSQMLDAYVPRNYEDAMRMSTTLHKSGMTGTLKNPESVFLILATGAELGFTPTASLRGFFSFNGKACPYADTIVAICLRSPSCEYFICTESTALSATFETKRAGSPAPQRNTFTWKEAEAAGLAGKDTYKAYPKDMLRHRAAAPLARMVYPDLVLGLHSIEEMRDAVTMRSDPTPEPQSPKREVLDAEVVAAPVYDDSLARLTKAYLDAKTLEEITAIRAEVAKLNLDKDGDDRKAMRQVDKEAVERIKAAG